MCMVTMTDDQVVRTSYMSTTPSVQTVTRGTGHSMQTFAETSETLTISTGRDLGLFVDWGDLAQSPWTKQADLFDRIGQLLNEFVETSVLAQHASWANLGDSAGAIALASTTTITVSATNVDDIIRAVKREIRIFNGQTQMNQNGVGIIWRPADFELLEGFVQALDKTVGLDKSSLIYGETPEEDNAYQPERGVQRLSEKTSIKSPYWRCNSLNIGMTKETYERNSSVKTL